MATERIKESSDRMKIWFKNNGEYSKLDEKVPVMCNEKIIGIISRVENNQVECQICDRFITKETREDFEQTYISSIGLKTNTSSIETIDVKPKAESSRKVIYTPYGKLQDMTYLQKFKWLHPEIWNNLYFYQKLFLATQFKGYDIMYNVSNFCTKTARKRIISKLVDKEFYKTVR